MLMPRMLFMKKVVVWLTLTVAVAGCQNTGPKNDQGDRMAGLRCWHFRDQRPLTEEDVEYIREQSEEGHPLCKMTLATMYERGLGVPKDVAEAKATYQAVASTNRGAYIELGRMAEEGIGEPVDYAKARQLYERAGASQGNASAATRLARLMEEGKGGPRDLEGALRLYVGAIDLYGDDAWDGIRRMRAKGLAMSAEQANKYNDAWWAAVQHHMVGKILNAQMELENTIDAGLSGKSMRLQFEFEPGSEKPRISVLRSSGDRAVDQFFVDAVSTYRFADTPIATNDKKRWVAAADFTVDGRK